MCERFSYIGRLSLLQSLYRLDISEVAKTWQGNVNIGAGEDALVLTHEHPKQLQMMRFGFTPEWAKRRMDILNARAEGDHNLDNDPAYDRAKGIIRKRAFRVPIRRQRCAIVANGFFLGNFRNATDSKYYFVYRNDRTPIFLAGIWDEWFDPILGEKTRGFAIITTPANTLIQKAQHKRSPVIIQPGNTGRWLSNNMDLSSITSTLKPFHPGPFDVHPISPLVAFRNMKDRNVLKPIGQRLNKRYYHKKEWVINLEGMGSTPARRRRIEEEKGLRKNND